MTKVQIVHPKIIERQQNPMKHIRDDAGRLIIEQLEKFKKKIPRKGLNNFTRKPYYWPVTFPYLPKPTLLERMEKLFWHTLYLPPQMVALGITSEEFNEDLAKSLMNDCIELLSKLHINLDSVTVVNKQKIAGWKKAIWLKKTYLLITAKALGMVQHAEFFEISDKEDQY